MDAYSECRIVLSVFDLDVDSVGKVQEMDTCPQCLRGRCNILQDLFRLYELTFLCHRSMDISLLESNISLDFFCFTSPLLLALALYLHGKLVSCLLYVRVEGMNLVLEVDGALADVEEPVDRVDKVLIVGVAHLFNLELFAANKSA